MAWALQFKDAVDNYTKLDSAISYSATDSFAIDITFKIDAATTNDIHTLLWYDNGNYFYYRVSTNQFYWRFGASIRTLNVSSVLVLGQELTISLISSSIAYKRISSVDFGDSSVFTSPRIFAFEDFGLRQQSIWPFVGELIKVEAYTDETRVSKVNNWSPDDSDRSNTGQQPKVVDTISGNDATGVNFPTDGSAWIDLGGGGLAVDVPLVLSESLAYSPTIEKELVTDVPVVLSETTVYDPDVLKSKEVIVDIVIPEIDVFSPLVQMSKEIGVPVVQAITEVYNHEVLKPLFITLDDIVNAQTEVFRPFVIIGDGIIVPVEDRFNYNKLANYLRSLGFEGNNNDVIMDWLFSEGYEVGQFNDRLSNYLTDLGYNGALPDQKGQWKG